jgi:hypothetical protein
MPTNAKCGHCPSIAGIATFSGTIYFGAPPQEPALQSLPLFGERVMLGLAEL